MSITSKNHHLLKLCLTAGLGARRIAKIIEQNLDLEKIESYPDSLFYDLGIDQKNDCGY